MSQPPRGIAYWFGVILVAVFAVNIAVTAAGVPRVAQPFYWLRLAGDALIRGIGFIGVLVGHAYVTLAHALGRLAPAVGQTFSDAGHLLTSPVVGIRELFSHWIDVYEKSGVACYLPPAWYVCGMTITLAILLLAGYFLPLIVEDIRTEARRAADLSTTGGVAQASK